MKRAIFAVFFILICNTLFLSAQKLSPKAKVSLLTCDPGKDLYAAFGHSALRVKDPLLGIDKVYNYGTFNFNTPNFYWKFVKGKLIYQLSVSTYQRFRYAYTYENRSIYEQVINATLQEKQQMFDFLEKNALPENKDYLYDFLYDNCSTRIRDVLITIYGNSLIFDDIDTTLTFRQMIRSSLTYRHWDDLGVNILLGTPTDKVVNTHQYMFLPDNLMYCFDDAVILKNGQPIPLVEKKATIFTGKAEEKQGSFFSPFLVFGTVLFIVLVYSVLAYRKQKWHKWLDLTLFIPFGILGLLLILLWTATDHHVTANNYNILWIMPLHLLFPFFLRKTKIIMYYFGGYSVLIVLLLVCWFIIPQELTAFIIPVILILLSRSVFIYLHLKRKIANQ